jgi:hypothetical protein
LTPGDRDRKVVVVVEGRGEPGIVDVARAEGREWGFVGVLGSILVLSLLKIYYLLCKLFESDMGILC